jgi:hypothetical protein
MEPMTVVAAITAAIPFVTAGIKRILTRRVQDDEKRRGINTLIPVVLGILCAGLYDFSQHQNWAQALAVGLGSGGAASSVRDIDRHVVGIVESLYRIARREKNEPPQKP